MKINNIYEDYYGDERIYSVLLDENELRLFASLEEDRTPLSDYESTKGIKRTIAADILLGGSGSNYLGRKAGIKEAELADLEGDSDSKIVKRAGRAGMKRGAITGAAINAGLGAALGTGIGILSKMEAGKTAKLATGLALRGGIGGALIGGIGGRNSARVLAKDKIRQRDEESDRRRKRSK